MVTNICAKCGREVKKKKEDYCKVERYLSGKKHDRFFYHLKCFEDRDNVKKLALGLAMKANQLLDKAGIQLS